jgi:hypothetical protein
MHGGEGENRSEQTSAMVEAWGECRIRLATKEGKETRRDKETRIEEETES